MPPLRSHSTPTSEDAWDGPGNEARLRDDEGAAYYRRSYAWQDPDGDPETKAAYKFVHHFVSEDGEIGAASTRAATTGIAVLNGARGGTTIPDGDRQGVWDHLARHLRDADIEPPELRAQPMQLGVAGVERRTYPLQEVRVSGNGKGRSILGYGAKFDVPSVPFWDFIEVIRPGAFSQTIEEDDIRALWNHEDAFVLGRNRAGTLKLAEDDVGLRFEIQPPETQWASDFIVSIERGDVDQASFRFNAREEAWNTEGGRLIRELRNVELFEISPVTFPAYPQTAVIVRSVLGMEVRDMETALVRLEAGTSTEADRRLLARLSEELRGRLEAAPPGRGQDGDEDPQRRARLAGLSRKLEIELTLRGHDQ